MADRRHETRDDGNPRRPRPAKSDIRTDSHGGTDHDRPDHYVGDDKVPAPTTPSRRTPRRTGLTRRADPVAQGAQVVATAGTAIVTAARVGRLLGRTGWRLARQLPGVDLVEQQAQRLRQAAASELLRMLEVPQAVFGPSNPEEQRAALLMQNAGDDPAPLRTAMTELLDRAGDDDRTSSTDYLYGTIVSQLVPDEARILAALATGRGFASVDVVAKQIGRSSMRTVLANVSTVGLAAGLASPSGVATYVGRLRGFGLVDIGPADDELTDQYDLLMRDSSVKAARADVDHGKQGSSRLVRRSVRLSQLGQEFWAACAPSPAVLDQRLG